VPARGLGGVCCGPTSWCCGKEKKNGLLGAEKGGGCLQVAIRRLTRRSRDGKEREGHSDHHKKKKPVRKYLGRRLRIPSASRAWMMRGKGGRKKFPEKEDEIIR